MGLSFICRLACDANHSTQSLLGGRGGCKEIARLPQRAATSADASSSGRRKTPNGSRDHRIVGQVAVGDEDVIQTCPACGCADGASATIYGRDTVRYASCNRFCYNAPRAETGREPRSLRTRPAIKVSQRARIAATAAADPVVAATDRCRMRLR
jgi:hypothetical protein